MGMAYPFLELRSFLRSSFRETGPVNVANHLFAILEKGDVSAAAIVRGDKEEGRCDYVISASSSKITTAKETVSCFSLESLLAHGVGSSVGCV